MKFDFQKKQAAFIENVIRFDLSVEMTDDIQLELEDALSEYLQTRGFDRSGNENEAGAMCVEILTYIAKHG